MHNKTVPWICLHITQPGCKGTPIRFHDQCKYIEVWFDIYACLPKLQPRSCLPPSLGKWFKAVDINQCKVCKNHTQQFIWQVPQTAGSRTSWCWWCTDEYSPHVLICPSNGIPLVSIPPWDLHEGASIPDGLSSQSHSKIRFLKIFCRVEIWSFKSSPASQHVQDSCTNFLRLFSIVEFESFILRS